MKIVLLSNSDIRGGASIAASRLYNTLRSEFPNTEMIVKNKLSETDGITACPVPDENFAVYEKIIFDTRHEFRSLGKQDMGVVLTTPMHPGCDVIDMKEFESADIVNIHSVRDFMSIRSIETVLASGKKVFFTIHDESMYTGGCVYTNACNKFTDSCDGCPQLKDFDTHSTYLHLRDKIERWGKYELNIIAPSKWMFGQAKKSKLLKDANIHHVANGIDVSKFVRHDKLAARKALKINKNKIVILFGAENLGVKRKGSHQLTEAISMIKNDERLKKDSILPNILLATFGLTSKQRLCYDFPIKSFGTIESDEQLSLIYSAADIFVLPSLEDNLPNTMLESMACGTPLVAFDTGGVSDVIDNDVNGIIAEQGNVDLLASSISDLILDGDKREKLSASARMTIAAHYSAEIQERKYMDVFTGDQK